MKTLIISLALVAFVCAHDPSAMNERLEAFAAKRAERQEKWNAMTEEERENLRNEHFKDIPEAVREKLREIHSGPNKNTPLEVREKLHEIMGSLTSEERQKFHESMKSKFAAKGHQQMAALSDEDKQKFHEKFAAIRERISSLPEEERRQEIQRLRNEHQERFQNFAPHKNIPVEVLQKLREVRHVGPRQVIPVEVVATAYEIRNHGQRKEIPLEVREKMHEVFGSLSDEERTEKIQQFRQKMAEKFESLSPEERQEKLEKMHRHRFEHDEENHQKFAKLTPEQREEIRKQVGSRPRPVRFEAVDQE